MQLPRFDLKRPSSFHEAVRLLVEYGNAAKISAGGTDLLPRMKYRIAAPATVISLKRIPVSEPFQDSEGNLHVHALVRLSDAASSNLVRTNAPALADAALAVGSEQIRNMGTLGGNVCLEPRCHYYNQSHAYQFMDPCFKRGGNLCYLVPKGNRCWALACSDTVPALIGLRAAAVVQSGDREYTIPVEELFTGDPVRPLCLGETDLITDIVVPAARPRTAVVFRKLSPRGGIDFATVNCAVMLKLSEDREACEDAIIAIGAVSGKPMRAGQAEKNLLGRKIAPDVIHEAAGRTASEIRPSMRCDCSISYLRKCIESLTQAALETAYQRASSGDGVKPD